MPYDRFVRWQLAGDEFAPDDPLALMATGFLGAGAFPHADHRQAEVEKDRYDELDDMAATTGTALLGLTIGCARCHDHKFDPDPREATTTGSRRLHHDRPQRNRAGSEPGGDRSGQSRLRKRARAVGRRPREFEREELPAASTSGWRDPPQDAGPPPAWIVLDAVEAKSARRRDAYAAGRRLAAGRRDESRPRYVHLHRRHARCRRSPRCGWKRWPTSRWSRAGRAGPATATSPSAKFSVTAEPLSRRRPPRMAVKLHRPAGRLRAKRHWSLPSPRRSTAARTPAGPSIRSSARDHAAVFRLRPAAGGVRRRAAAHVHARVSSYNAKHAIGRPRLSASGADAGARARRQRRCRQSIVESLQPAATERRAADRSAAARAARLASRERSRMEEAQPDGAERTKPRSRSRNGRRCRSRSEGLPPMPHHADAEASRTSTPRRRSRQRGDVNRKEGDAPPGFLHVLMRGAGSGRIGPCAPPQGWTRTSLRRATLANWITDAEYGAGNLAGPRDRQSAVAASLRPRDRRHAQRLRRPGRAAHASRTARLAGRRADPRRLAAQAAAQADR